MRNLTALAALAAAVILFALFAPAWSQDRGAWFKSLKQPGSGGVSCCDISDCKKTESEWRGGQWHARSNRTGEMTPVPHEKVINNVPSIDGEAYLCESSVGTLYCFVPPDFGT